MVSFIFTKHKIQVTFFSNNLKNNYDPTGDDAAMEQIVQEILAKGHFEVKK